MLGRSVGAREGDAELSCDAGHERETAAPSSDEMRNYQSAQVNDREDVLKMYSNFILYFFLNGPFQASFS